MTTGKPPPLRDQPLQPLPEGSLVVWPRDDQDLVSTFLEPLRVRRDDAIAAATIGDGENESDLHGLSPDEVEVRTP